MKEDRKVLKEFEVFQYDLSLKKMKKKKKFQLKKLKNEIRMRSQML